MGNKFVIKMTPRGLVQVPLEKYTLLGESNEIKPEEIKKIGDSLGVDWSSISLTQLHAGTKVEAEEHQDVMNGRLEVAVRIALAHLREIPDYYTRLKIMEAKAGDNEIPNTDANIRNADESYKMTKEYQEEQHPRDEGGKWTSGGGGESKEGSKVEDGSASKLSVEGRTFNTKEFSNAKAANAFLEKNPDYGVVGEKEGAVHVARNQDVGSPDVARTIVQQLGGNKFLAMTGAKNFAAEKDSVKFSIPKAKDSINRVTIQLTPKDTYDVSFHRVIGANIKEVAHLEDIYADQLQEVFTRHTGLDTHL